MNKFKRSLSVLTSAAISASMLSAFAVTAVAKTSPVSWDWEEVENSGFSDAGRGGTTLAADFEGNAGTSVEMHNSGGTNGTVKRTFDNIEAAHIGIEYDAYFTTNQTNTKYIAIGASSLGRMSGNSVGAANTVLAVGNSTSGNISVNGINTGIAPAQWIHVAAVADFASKKIDVTITPASGDAYNGTVDFLDPAVTGISGVTLNSNRGVTDKAIYLDNLVISTYDEAVIETTGESVSVETDGSAGIATVTGVENDDAIEASSADESVVTVSVENGAVTAQYVGSGKTTVTIKATSPDGVSVTKTVDVIAGSVELTEVAVKYVDSENNEIAEGYSISEVPVGSVLTLNDVNFEDTILTSAYRYTNPSAADCTAVSGENTLYVVYTDKSAAVSVITVSYQADGAEIASKTAELEAGLYEGDSYTYYSTAYIKDADGTIYAVGADFTDDAESVILNGQNPAVNAVLKQTITLVEDTKITYDAVKSPNAVLYSEWEDILGTSTWGLDSRYVASGGKVTSTSSRVSFYEVPATGYYQIIVAGGTRNRGVAVYASEEAAAAATAIDDGTAILTYKNQNNTAYGLYTAKTALLTEGGNLTLRGFGSNGATDDLDYVVVRRIVSGDIIGADGVSIIPGGQVSAYSFDSGLSEAPAWSVTGVEGVTIDENGVLTVAENAAEGTATITAEIASAGVSGTKDVTIAKAQITEFTIGGPAVVSKGSENTYSAENVTDQYGVAITSAVTVSYASSENTVVSIDPITGAAKAENIGSADITVTVKVGGSELSKTKTVTVNKFYLEGTTSEVDASNLMTSDNITGYRVTTAKDGAVVDQYDVTELPASVELGDADSYEIDPIYTYNNLSGVAGSGYTAADVFADGFYNMTFTKGDTKRADINVNGYMVGNNVDQYGEGRSIAGGTEYTIHDAVVTGGSIKITTTDRGGDGSISKAVIVKAPSNVTRKTKLYVTGDSLVADYYGTYAEGTEVGGARTGWGQQLHNFITDDMEVVNLANSGQYAAGLLTSAFPGIIAMAQPGDYFILESGYNDRNYSNTTEMYESVVSMVEQAEEKGLNVVLVSPNASAHDYKAGVMYASTMTRAAEDMIAKYDNVIYVDLAGLSYNFMMSTGISTTVAEAAKVFKAVKDENGVLSSVSINDAAAGSNVKMPDYGTAKYYIWNAADGEGAMKPASSSSTANVVTTYNLTAVGGDTLHSSYAGAMKWAEIVAQGMKDGGAEFINTDFSYTFTDTIGNEITCQVK